jgi:P-type Mg2+ transporter
MAQVPTEDEARGIASNITKLAELSAPLLIALTIGVVLLGLSIPLTPLGPVFGFVEPPLGFYVLFALAIAAYLLLVEAVKRHLYGRVFGPSNR